MFEASTLANAGKFEARELAMAVWAVGRLARWGVPPPSAHWWERFWAASSSRMLPGEGAQAEAARHAVVALHAAALVGRAPPCDWLQAVLEAAAAETGETGPAQQEWGHVPPPAARRAARVLGAVARLQRSTQLEASGASAAAVGVLVERLAHAAWALPAEAAVPALAALPDLAPMLPPATQRRAAVHLAARCGALTAWPVQVLHALARLQRWSALPAQPEFWEEVSAAGRHQQAIGRCSADGSSSSGGGGSGSGSSGEGSSSSGLSSSKIGGGAGSATLPDRPLHSASAAAAFWRRLEAALLQDLPTLGPDGAAAAALAFAELRHSPSPPLARALVAAAARAAASERRAAAAPRLLLALGDIGCGRAAAPADVSLLLDRLEARVDGWSGAQLAAAACGVARLVTPNRVWVQTGGGAAAGAALHAWLSAWLGASRAAMRAGAMGPEDVARAASALARLRVEPGDAWLCAAVGATSGRLAELRGAAGLARLATSLVRLGAQPGAAWQEELADAAVAAAGAAHLVDAADAASAAPGEAGASPAAADLPHARMQPVHVGLLALAWHRWGWTPPAGVAQALLAACRPAWRRPYHASSTQLALTLLAAAGWAAPDTWVQDAALRAQAAAVRSAYSEAQLDKVVWALQVLRM
ncbi:hypothetical protein Rsub_12353 [Raphidocelis subcapitata]|uniref:RAP domain-containing protein n=1 Tax=Raphidocelis subcapitata TaxID=307507 RepID=A0A2V0PPY8_9CHLO|nr:hypothetical protein Rsub_12353 [Raphidocelis subcapitata]|eukprot:GBF99547.1 hypothetical protein Rsub_12353 [Raphidocelis subcapitata]